MKRKIVIGLVAIVVAMQFFRIDKENPTLDSNNDFIVIMKPSEEVSIEDIGTRYTLEETETHINKIKDLRDNTSR